MECKDESLAPRTILNGKLKTENQQKQILKNKSTKQIHDWTSWLAFMISFFHYKMQLTEKYNWKKGN